MKFRRGNKSILIWIILTLRIHKYVTPLWELWEARFADISIAWKTLKTRPQRVLSKTKANLLKIVVKAYHQE